MNNSLKKAKQTFLTSISSKDTRLRPADSADDLTSSDIGSMVTTIFSVGTCARMSKSFLTFASLSQTTVAISPEAGQKRIQIL